MPRIYQPEDLKAIAKYFEDWVSGLVESDNPVASKEQTFHERTGTPGWYIRMLGDQKSFIGVWFQIGQRTLQYENYFMPAPTQSEARLYAYLLQKNFTASEICFSIGPERAVYLAGRTPLEDIYVQKNGLDTAKLEDILGAIYTLTENHFRVAMGIGLGVQFQSQEN